MMIALVIAGGVVVVTALGLGFDLIARRSSRVDTETKQKVAILEQRMAETERAVQAKDERVARLEGDVAFLNRLLEKK